MSSNQANRSIVSPSLGLALAAIVFFGVLLSGESLLVAVLALGCLAAMLGLIWLYEWTLRQPRKETTRWGLISEGVVFIWLVLVLGLIYWNWFANP
jgi:hypothetical protein